MKRGGSGGESLGRWHGTVVKKELGDLVVSVSASVVKSGTTNVVDLVNVTLVAERILHGSDDLGEELLAFLNVSSLGSKVKLSHVCLTNKRKMKKERKKRVSAFSFGKKRGKKNSVQRGDIHTRGRERFVARNHERRRRRPRNRKTLSWKDSFSSVNSSFLFLSLSA